MRRAFGGLRLLRCAFLATSLLIVVAPPLSTRANSHISRPNAPALSDWHLFGRDRNNDRFSPLVQINQADVGHLGVAWSQSLGQFQVLAETFPQVVEHTLYVTTSTDEVIAMNAVTGKELWKYAPRVNFSLSTGVGGYGVSVNRGVAIADGKVFLLTFDDHLQALSQATGERLWDSSVANPHQGGYETMAPTVWKGLVYVGLSGSEDGVRGQVAAYSVNSGKLVWRFYTVPAPGHGWVPANGRHGGGTIYMPPTVDTETGLIYVGTGNPSPVFLGTGRQGTDPHTDSVLALRASTGTLVWAHQEIAHDLWDYDAESPVVIFNTRFHGHTVRAVGEAGKSGFYFIMNARTGQDLFPPLAFVKENHKPPTTQGVLECPGSVGGSQYGPVAYSPRTHAAYVSGINLCMIMTVTPGKPSPGGGESDLYGTRIPQDKTPTGTFSAVNVRTGHFLWRHTMPTPMIGGATATASNLVWTGDQHGILYAFNAQTGKEVWHGNLGLAFGSAPIVYAINHTEYVAAAIGGSALTASLSLGNVGARVVVLKLGGKRITPYKGPGSAVQP